MNLVFYLTKRKEEDYISNCRLLIALWVRCHWCGDLAAQHTIIWVQLCAKAQLQRLCKLLIYRLIPNRKRLKYVA